MKKPTKKAKPKAKPMPRLSAPAIKRQRENFTESIEGSPFKPVQSGWQASEDIKEMIDKMIADSKLGTERERERLDSLNRSVDDTERYAYVTFPGPIADYLDYIKSTNRNLKSWSNIESFVKYTDKFWKLMRDQSLKIVMNAAKELIPDYPGYRSNIISLYISRLEKEIGNNESSDELRTLLSLILGYDEHESNVIQAIERSEYRYE
jgi:hypothetical protein